MKLLFFAGPPKTGTTAFQYHANKLLNNIKFYYPKSCQWSDSSHHPLLFSYFGINQWGELGSNFQVYLDELKHEINGLEFHPETLVLSSEALAYQTKASDFMFELADGLKVHSQDIKVVFFCRNYEEVLLSRYNQNIKDFNTEFVGAFNKFFEKYFDKLYYSPLKFNDINQFSFENYHPSDTFISRIFKKYFDIQLAEVAMRNTSMSTNTILNIAILRHLTNFSQAEVFSFLKENNLLKYGKTDTFLSYSQKEQLIQLYSTEIKELKISAIVPEKEFRTFDLNDFYLSPKLVKEFQLNENEIYDFLKGYVH